MKMCPMCNPRSVGLGDLCREHAREVLAKFGLGLRRFSQNVTQPMSLDEVSLARTEQILAKDREVAI